MRLATCPGISTFNDLLNSAGPSSPLLAAVQEEIPVEEQPNISLSVETVEDVEEEGEEGEEIDEEGGEEGSSEDGEADHVEKPAEFEESKSSIKVEEDSGKLPETKSSSAPKISRATPKKQLGTVKHKRSNGKGGGRLAASQAQRRYVKAASTSLDAARDSNQGFDEAQLNEVLRIAQVIFSESNFFFVFTGRLDFFCQFSHGFFRKFFFAGKATSDNFWWMTRGARLSPFSEFLCPTRMTPSGPSTLPSASRTS
jgi:hypothetical protein